MPRFAKRDKTPDPLVPVDVLSLLHDFGEASWQSKQTARPLSDPRFGWDPFFSRFLPAYQQDLPRAIAEVHSAAGSDQFARYGGYRLVAEFDGACPEPLYLDMMDAALTMMCDNRLSSGHMTGHERDRWVAVHGDVRTSFDRLVEATPPPADAVSGLVLQPGQRLMVARMGSHPLDNEFWIERLAQGTYQAFSMRQQNSDSVSLTRCEEQTIGVHESVENLLRSMGQYFQRPTPWSHAELDPYFLERRSG